MNATQDAGQSIPGSLIAFATRVLGAVDLIADYSWGHRMSSVIRLRDSTGADWFLKQHRDRERYLTEVSAYHCWVPALGNRAPRLRATEDSLQAVILSALPAVPSAWPVDFAELDATGRAEEALVHHGAGALLRRFHDGQPVLAWDDFAAAKADEFDQLVPFAAGLLTSRDLTEARSQVAELASLPCPGKVACHRDYTPRNWLVDDAASVYVVDFEWSRQDVWLSDLARLHLDIWAARPDLQDAFMSGYGRELTGADHAILHGCAVLTGVWLLVKAHETHQPSFEDGSRKALQRLMRKW